MIPLKAKTEKIGLEKAIDTLFSEMENFNGDDEEYAKMVAQLEKLYKLKTIDGPRRVSPDTLAIVAGNFLGIVLIVTHERAHIVTSKALNFILKPR